MIIVGIDGSAPSRAAMLWGARRASDLGSDLVLLAVGSDTDDDLRQTLSTASIEAKQVHPTLSITQLIRPGHVVDGVIGAATYEDMIVIGTHKTGYIRGRVLGTHSMEIALAAPCPVAVIPDSFLAARSGVVVGTYDDSPWKVAVELAAHESERLGQDLTIVFAGDDDDDRGHSRDVLSMAALAAQRAAPGLTVTRRAAPRRASESLLDGARNAALLVLEYRGDRPDPSIIQEVLLNATSPVLIAR